MTQRATVAVVSGHSSGLGAAVANGLLERGIRVLGIARRANESLAEAYGDRLVQAAVDLSDGAALDQWLADGDLEGFVQGARLALLVNNAGVLQPIGPLDAQAPDAVGKAVAVNVAAPLALAAAFVTRTSAAEERRILHVSSGAGRRAYAGWSVYCACKAALDHHARAVQLDGTPRLRIASVAPGVIDTAMQAEIRASSEEDFPDRARFETMKREGMLATPEVGGRALVEHLLVDEFGREPVTDIRSRHS
jgi:NADP-dependent 3-hydroxy acid dehydrogenase YdfG